MFVKIDLIKIFFKLLKIYIYIRIYLLKDHVIS